MSMKLRRTDTRWSIALINGPNMKYLGRRDEGTFGPIPSIAALEDLVGEFADDLGVALITLASDSEAEIVEFVQTAEFDGVIINPAGLTMVGHSARDALVDRGRPYIEVHFANLVRYYNEVLNEDGKSAFTYTSSGLVMGLRHHGYLSALLALVALLDDGASTTPPT